MDIDERKNKLVISFMHSNYLIRSAGTEKFISTYSKIIQKNGCNHLNFFSFYSHKSLLGIQIAGVNYNDEFIGIIKYCDIEKFIEKIVYEKNMSIEAIHLQHMQSHSLTELSKIINRWNAPTYVFVHDFFVLCDSPHLVDSQGKYCGATIPNENKCKKCSYKGIIHFSKMKAFFSEIEKKLVSVIVPSDFVKNAITECFPEFSKKVFVRPHLIITGKKNYSEISGKIRIAFAGRQSEEKGFKEWCNLVTSTYPKLKEKYEFYYLGIDSQKIQGVSNIYVSIAQQGKNAMIDAIKKNDIACAFVWPLCAETYSYVYYELSLAGVFMLSNSISGNIAVEIENNENGKVFETLEECKEWLKDYELVVKTINEYRINGKFRPANYEENENVQLSTCESKLSQKTVPLGKMPRCKILILETAIYKFRFKNKGLNLN